MKAYPTTGGLVKQLVLRVIAVATTSFMAGTMGMREARGSVVILGFERSEEPTVNDAATLGFAFEMATDFTVTRLGMWEYVELSESHQVGLWDELGNQKAVATVTPSSDLVSEFRYASIGPEITLPAGRYVLGAHYTNPSADKSVLLATSVTTGTGVTFLGARLGGDETALAFPDLDLSFLDRGVFGPNMEFTAFPAPVPEPRAYALAFAVGMAAFAIWRRRNPVHPRPPED